jgi:hypothetical protein
MRVGGRASGGSNINQSLRIDAGDSYFGGKVYPDSGIWTGPVLGHIPFYRTDGTMVVDIGGTTGNFNVTNGAKYYLYGFPIIYKNSNTVRILQEAVSDSSQGIAFRDSSDAANLLEIRPGGALVMRSYTFATKPSAPSAGMVIFCSDCTRPSDPATDGGTGGLAIYANSRWYVP